MAWGRGKRSAMSPVAIGEGDMELLLIGVDGEKVPVIRVLRERMELRLGEAYALIRRAPVRIARDLEDDVAHGFRKELEEAGASVQVRRSSMHLRLVP